MYKLICKDCEKENEFETCDIPYLDNDIDAQASDAHDDGYDEGISAGRQDIIDDPPEPEHRETDYRLSLYRAIYAGDIFKAREIVDLMAMIDIDRDLIWKARGK